MTKRISMAGVLALAAASAAQAGVVISITEVVPTQSSVALAGYTGYVFSVATDNGATVTAIDFGGTAGSPYSGITGHLLQRSSVITGEDDDGNPIVTRNATAYSTSKVNYDSHWLTSPEVVLIAPSENNDHASHPGIPVDTATLDYGWGSVMNITAGYYAVSQKTALDVFYVVIPTGETFNYSGRISTTIGGYDISGVGGSAVPEPASLGVLALAGFGMWARRRR